MLITVDMLDERICDVEECENTQTYREFIRQTEDWIGIEEADIDNMTNIELTNYIEFLDEMWNK